MVGIELMAILKKSSLKQSKTLFSKEKDKCQPFFLVKTMVYRSNIYHTKIHQNGN